MEDVELVCMHFAREYRKWPDDTYDLLGIFNTLRFPAFPATYRYVVYALLRRDPDESGAVVPITMVSTSPGGGRIEWGEAPVMREAKGTVPPTLWWVSQITATFSEPGYYSYEVRDTEWDRVLGSARLLVSKSS